MSQVPALLERLLLSCCSCAKGKILVACDDGTSLFPLKHAMDIATQWFGLLHWPCNMHIHCIIL